MGVGSALVSRQLSDLEAREQALADTIEAEGPARTTPAATTVKKAAATKKVPAKKAPAKKAAPRS